MIKVSVIVPVYNVERYLRRCIDSILRQSFLALEIILVDDGSEDSSGAICDEYCMKDERIRVIHKKNGGLSSARNAGISMAKGEYIALIDSDDFIYPNMIEKMYSKARECKVDMVMCGYECRSQSDDTILLETHNITLDCIVDSQKALEYLVDGRFDFMVMAWNKLYHRNLFVQNQFTEGKLHEDEFIIHKLLYECNNVVFLPICLYNYMIGKQSITTVEYNVKRLDGIEALFERKDFFQEHELEIYTLKEMGHIIQALIISIEKSKFGKEFRSRYKEFQYRLKKDKKNIMNNPYIRRGVKVWSRIFLASPWMSSYVLKLLHIKKILRRN